MRWLFLTTIATLSILSSCTSVSSEKPKTVKKVVKTNQKTGTCKKRPIVVVVVDTGFGKGMIGSDFHLCKYGHRDFTNGATTDEYNTADPVPVDDHGHGTHIAGLINELGKRSGVNFCLVIMKYWNTESNGTDNLEGTIKSFQFAKNIHANYINYSGGGIMRSEEEEKAVKEFLDQGGKFFAAAGNEGVNIDFFHFYPASYDDRIVKVGGLNPDGSRMKISNYGTNVKFETGKNVLSTLPGGQMGYMSGSSQATATATGKMLAQEKDTCN